MGTRRVLCIGVCTLLVACMIVPTAALGMTISGTVTDYVSGKPLEGIEVRAYRALSVWESDGPYASGIAYASASTDATGTYSIEGLDSDGYVVAFCDLGNVYRDLTWPQRGLPIPQGYAVPPDFEEPVDAKMVTYQYVIDNRVQRIAGANRYSTAIEIVKENFGAADTAVLVSGEDFPDALCATPLASLYDAPLLLTKKDSLPAGLTKLLKDLGVQDVIIVGGEEVVSPAVVSQLHTAGFGNVDRIAGKSRYGTSAIVAKLVNNRTGGSPFVCRGDDFPDALAAGPFAYMMGMPILLTKPDELPSEIGAVWSDMSIGGNNFALVVGGKNAVSDTVLQALADLSKTDGELYYYRFAGADRYETARMIVDEMYYNYDIYGLATGKDFPDALAGGAALGHNAGALLLTEDYRLNPQASDYLGKDHFDAIWLEVFGGTKAIKNVVMDQAYKQLGRYHRDFDQAKTVGRGVLEDAPFTSSLGACDIGVASVGVYADTSVTAAAEQVDSVGRESFDLSSIDWSVMSK